METLWTSKKFIIISTVFVGLMCVFTIVGILKTNKELSNNYQNAISFNGHGEVKAVPDIATFSLTIRQEAKTVKESDAKVVVVEKKVLDFLKTKNISDKDIKVEGKTLPAGKYSLYVLPGEKEWTFFFNSEVGQWGIKRGGDTTKDPAKDVLSVKVKAAKSASMNERLVYEVSSKGIVLRWENSEAMVSIK